MELDPIETFLQQGTKRFSLSMLINAHSRLSILQMNKGSIALEDIIQSLSLTSTVEISSVELNAHAALIYEGTLVPVLTSKGPVLRLNKEMIANDANFLKGILNVMFGHAVAIGAGSNAVVEEFRNEAMTFLKRSTPSTSSLPSALAATGPTTSSPGAIPAVPTAATAVVGGGDLNAPVEASVASTPETLVNGRPPSETTKASPTLLADAPPFQPSGFNPLPTNTSMVSPVPPNSGGFGVPGMTNPRPATSLSPLTANPGVINPARVPAQFPPQVASPAIPGRPNPLPGARPLYPQEEIDSMPVTDVERTEPVANLLAHIRKEGMDILFPPIIHDKVLMAVFAAMRSAAPLAHRELIDMVMAVKEAAAVNQLENLSRNKVRGILALLKHAQLFITHGADGDAVRLHLANGVNTFRDLRDRHDAFLNRYMILHHLFIPVTLKCDLVWQLDMETKNRRLEELKSLEFVLLDFFKTYYLGARGLKTTTGPLPPSNQGMGGLGGVPSGDYGGPNYGNKMRDMRYEGELTDDRYRYLDQANNSAQIYDPYNRKPPTHPNQAGGNLVYSTGRPVGSSVVSSAGAIPSGVTRPYGAIPASSSALSYNNQNYTPNNYRSLQSAPVSAVPPRVPPSAGYRSAESEYSAMGLSPQTFHKVSEGGGPSVYGSKGYSVPVDRGGVLDGLTGGGGGGGVVGGYNYYGLEDPNDERYSMRSSLGGHQSMNGGSGLTGSESSSLYGNAVGGLLSGGKKDILSAFADPYSSRDAGSSWNVPTFATEEAPASIKNEPSWATSSSNWYSTASDPVEGVSSSSFNAAPTLSSTSTTNSNTPAATATGPPPALSSTSNNNNTANTFINVATGLSEAEQLDSLISDDQELVIPDPSTITINVKETLQNSSEPVIEDSETFPE